MGEISPEGARYGILLFPNQEEEEGKEEEEEDEFVEQSQYSSVFGKIRYEGTPLAR